MLTDTKLKNLKPQDKLYKVTDRDGLYVAVSPAGTVTFRYDYRLNGRRETLTIGRYGPAGLSLAAARESLIEAKKDIAAGKSPAKEKQRGKRQDRAAKTFGEFTVSWLADYGMAESTKAMRESILNRDILPVFQNHKLGEITDEDLRSLCDKIKARGAPATAVHAREIVQQIYRWAIERGQKVTNPADTVSASSIATFKPKDRALSPDEIRIFFQQLELVSTLPTIRLALKLVLLTMVRKSELLNATWPEVNFTDAVWTISADRMKARRPHNVYLSQQTLDIMIALKTCAGGSKFLLPSRYEGDKGMSNATLNRVIDATVERAQAAGLPLESFGVHDLRRTASTLLHEAGFNSDWIEKCLAHEQKGVRAVYNKAEYVEQRRDMLQKWADMVDGWIAGAEKKA
ncbi:tyrosine-type recombinase/integrase [Aquitalea magnusonii]|uniref:Site-specific recombinase XerD n=1 Tax=Aquitalea magnusonii TaxID=332411 RepID=A0A318J3D6_9NEIS|nr:integrase arm-type DNA-binding domain-containing protein [Aquitalea magnusonii]PXX42257.1 site-specific recombinase XerD [Aquitalea magnusonii]